MRPQIINKILPLIGKGTGITAIALITLAAADAAMSQVGSQGFSPAIMAFLAGLFSDVVVGRAIDQLFLGPTDDNKVASLLQEFDKHFERIDFRQEVAQLLHNQRAFTEVIGAALKYHEDSAVERILRGAASYQDFKAEEIIKTLQVNHSDVISRLDPEVQYLTDVIFSLQAQGGTWLRYVDLAVRTDSGMDDQVISAVDTWGLPRVFSLLDEFESKKSNHGRSARTVAFHSIEQVLGRHRRFVLVGDAGSGKTTTIQHLALESAKKRLSEPKGNRIPIFLHLASWGAGQSIEEFILSRWRLVPDPVGMLLRGDAELFLDGLNEMGLLGPSKALALREWLQSDRGPERIIVTCRQSDYDESSNLGLPVVRIEKMTHALVRQFTKKYLGEQADVFLAKLTPGDAGGGRRRHLAVLAKNPFTLTALMVVFRNSPQGELPRNPGALLHRLVVILWDRERIRNTRGWISQEKLDYQLGYLAYRMINEHTPVDISMDFAQTSLQSDGFIFACQSAGFLERRDKSIRFQHQLLQEYFAATYLTGLSVADVVQKPRFSHKGRVSQKWDEVIVALSGISNQPVTMAQVLKVVDPYLAALCIERGAHFGLALEVELQDIFVSLLNHSNLHIRLAAAKALGQISWRSPDSQTEIAYRIALFDWVGCTKMGANAIPPLIAATTDADDAVREGALWAIQEIEDNLDSSMLTTLIGANYGDRDPDDLVRWVMKHREGVWEGKFARSIKAIRVDNDLSESTDPDQLLEELSNPVESIRRAALIRLGELRLVEAVPAIITMLGDGSVLVSIASIWTLGEIGDARAVLALIAKLQSPICSVRWFAASALGKIADSAAVAALIEKLHDLERPDISTSRVCDVAAVSLENIGTQEAVLALQAWKRSDFP